MKSILTVAGLDPSGGAGITADLNVFQSFGMHGVSVPTCCVVQGPHGVTEVYPTPIDAFNNMLDEIKDVELTGMKIGVLYDEPYIEKIIDFIKSLPESISIVLDPVFSSKNRKELLTERGVSKLKTSLLSCVSVITPNREEAEILTGISIKDENTMERAAIYLFNQGVKKAVIIKGGHLKGEPKDLLFDGIDMLKYSRERLEKEVHGTGCVFSSLFTSYLCLGYPVGEAFYAVEADMDKLLKNSYRISQDGYYYMSTGVLKSQMAERYEVLKALNEAKDLLCALNPVELIPEVQMNIGYAVKNAQTDEDVAAFPGRISVYNKRVFFKGEPSFGASSHVARLILGMMKKYPYIRSCANIKYSEKTIEKAKKNNLNIIFFDRKFEPDEIRQKEGKSLDYLTGKILSETDRAPDIIYDVGDIGKEPMIRLFGRNPIEIIKKMEMIMS